MKEALNKAIKELLIQNGTLVTPEGQQRADVLLRDGQIAQIAPTIEADAETLDAQGLLLFPGLIDLHCHLREPGFEYKETIQTGAQAAAKGGFTAVCCMANTQPVNDTAAVTAYIRMKAEQAGYARVYPIGAITKGLKGEELTEMSELKNAGCVALSDDGKPVASGSRMQKALLYAQHSGLPLVSHPEDLDLVDGGVMNEGYWSTILGLPGATRAAEEAMIQRDCLLAEVTGGRLHIAHVSTEGGVDAIRRAKARGARVSCETAPHYLMATDAWVEGYDTNTRVNPPLRTDADIAALIAGIQDGTIDCIATDHAPHYADEKRVEYALAASGISGFETALGICWTQLVAPGHITASRLAELMSAAPARLFGLPGGALRVGAAADITLIDPDRRWTVDKDQFISLGKNTPFHGKELTGAVAYTFVGGKRVYDRGVEA